MKTRFQAFAFKSNLYRYTVAWTFLKRFAVGDNPEPGGGGGGSKTKAGYTLVVNSSGGDGGGGGGGGGGKDDVEMAKLPTSTKASTSKPPSALAKAGKNAFGAGRGKKH